MRTRRARQVGAGAVDRRLRLVGGRRAVEVRLGPVDDDESVAAIRYAVEQGVNWVDTAAVYGLGHSEEVVGSRGRALPRRRGRPRLHEVRAELGRAPRGSDRERPAARVDPCGVRGQPAPPRRRADRPLPDPLARLDDRDGARGVLGDDGRAGRRGQGTLDRRLQLRRRAARALRGDPARRLGPAAAVAPCARVARRRCCRGRRSTGRACSSIRRWARAC